MSMADRDGVLWYDGQMVPWRSANTHVLTHSLHYGLAVFEGIRAYDAVGGTALFRLQDHIERLLGSAHILNMKVPYDAGVLTAACHAAVGENGLRSAYVRPLCFYGAEGMGLRADNLRVHVIVAAWSWDAYLGKEGIEQGIRVKTASIARHHVNVTMCKAKATGSYMNSMLALQEARAAGCDEALLLDTEGYAAEGSGENLFVVRKGILYTPELTSALDGITRDTIIALATEAGIAVREKRITRDEIYVADEAFFTGTAAEVTPIRELDGRRIGRGERGPMTEKLQTLYFDTVYGRRPARAGWLSPLAPTVAARTQKQA